MIIRILIMIYGEWHDSKGESLNDKFSDIDYGVYTDAARYVLNKESPYSRHTYRYTPLVSYLMLVNLWIHPCSGKLLFIMVDLIICLLLKAILTLYNSSLS
jgi:phosphatidylinositol glycan class M